MCVCLAGATLVAHALHGLGVWGSPADTAGQALYVTGIFTAGIACLARAVGAARERGAWLAIGVGLLLWGFGDLYYTTVLADDVSSQYPSPTDILFFAYYATIYVGVMLLCRSRIENFRPSMWLDGAIGASAMAAIATAFLYPSILQATEGDAAQVATQLAYPMADLLLVIVLVGAIGLSGWRMGRDWALLILGMAIIGVADVVYLDLAARGTYAEGDLLDSAWIAGTTAVTIASVARARPRAGSRIHEGRVLVGPSLFALVAVVILTYDHFDRVPTVSIWLATAALTLVIIRLVMAYLENARSEQRIEELSGLLPICSGCKNIRDDQGYWGQIESYVSAHSSAEFTHGICPDCVRRLYPDLVEADGEQAPLTLERDGHAKALEITRIR